MPAFNRRHSWSTLFCFCFVLIFIFVFKCVSCELFRSGTTCVGPSWSQSEPFLQPLSLFLSSPHPPPPLPGVLLGTRYMGSGVLIPRNKRAHVFTGPPSPLYTCTEYEEWSFTPTHPPPCDPRSGPPVAYRTTGSRRRTAPGRRGLLNGY